MLQKLKFLLNINLSTINLKCNELSTRGHQKNNNIANKRQVKRFSSSFEHSVLFHSLGNMVDSEDITIEKVKTQVIFLAINTLSDTSYQNATVTDNVSESPQIPAVDPNNKSKPQL